MIRRSFVLSFIAVIALLVSVAGATAQNGMADLVVALTGPPSTVPGGAVSLTVEATNQGTADAPGNAGTIDPGNGYVVDLILSTDEVVPEGYATPGPYAEDVLLTGGRISNTPDILAGSSAFLSEGNPSLPDDTPPGSYFICARIDPGGKVPESDEDNNTDCWPIQVVVPGQTQTTSHDFLMDDPHSVPFVLFNVLTEGTIQAVITWTGDSTELTATLTGRRRPDLPDPTAPYAQITGTSPITLTYTVTTDDLARGVGWRLALTDPAGVGDATGTIELTVPFDAALDEQFQQEKVSLRSGDLWPNAVLTAQFLGDLGATSGEGLHGIISLNQACDCYKARALEQAGIFRQSFLPGRNSFGFVRKGVDLSDPEIAGLVRAITPLEPEDKIDPHVLLRNYRQFRLSAAGESPFNYVLHPDGSLSLLVLFARDASPERINEILALEAMESTAMSDHLRLIKIADSDVTDLAAFDEVEWIGPGTLPFLHLNATTRATINVNPVHNAVINAAANTIVYNGLSGNGVNIGIHDSGIDGTHPDLNVVGTVNPPASAGSHGTHVAGIAAGSGVNSNTVDMDGDGNLDAAFQWRGMAPLAGLIDMGGFNTNIAGGVFQNSSLPAGDLQNAIQNNSLDISNHSHLLSVDGNYDAVNQLIDQEIRGGAQSGGSPILRRPQVFAAGNNGNAVQTATGISYGNSLGLFALLNELKNAIVVGNWDAINNRLRGSSSMGPAYDGRIKPDVVAPGTGVISTGTVGDGACVPVGTNASNSYTSCTGTSMATPAVTGVLALMLQAWQNTYATPLGTTIDANPPLPSTLRAILIQTATDIVRPNEDANGNGVLDPGEDLNGDGVLDLGVRAAPSAEVDSDSNPANGNDGNGFVAAPAGPDYATGWGLVNAQAAVNLMQDFRMENGVPVPNRIIQDTATQGQINEYDFVVDQPGPLRVTLAWDDVEASPAIPAVNPTLVNDLDLELVAPDGTVFYPWQLGHTILDAAGNPLPDNAQPPGTTIQVQIAVAPALNPVANNDYIPANAMTGNGGWVARAGKDHLNNVEQVFVDVPAGDPDLIGHWKVRVIGFNVQPDFQDYSVVGFPYPDLPELVAFSDDKVGIPGLNQDITFTWSYSNIGPVGTGGPFDYQILLSDDFFLGDDVVLADSASDPGLPSLGALAASATASVTSTVQISQADVDALLGAGATFDDLLNADAFLLVRVDSEDDVLEHNETNVTFVQLARLVDVVMVMDRSGSMGSTVPVSNGSQTKLQILQDSANLFLDLLRKDAGDRLGQVSFATNASIDFDDGSGQVTDFGVGNVGDARTAVNNLSAGGSTNIRDALQGGLDMIPADGDRRKVIVFFSDGMKTAGGDPTEPAFLQQFDDEGIKVFSVGFGTEGGSGNAGIDTDLLETLANVGEHGFFHVTESATGLDKFFVNAVAGAVDAQVIVDPIADIGPGATHTVDVAVGDHELIATFVLTWDDPTAELELSLRGPAATRITAVNAATFGDRVSLITAPAYKLMTVHLPIAAGPNQEHGGWWEMVIHNPGANTVRYSASVIAESTIQADAPQPQPPDGVGFKPGDPVNLQFSLRQLGGVPISDADIIVIPNVPLVSLGDLLSVGLITEADLAEVPAEINGEELSLRERMVIALQNLLGEDPLPRADGAPFPLTETGTPGTYAGSFTDTHTPGFYTFTLRAEGLADRCQPVQRESVETVSVGPVVNADLSEVIITTPGDGSYTVAVTPFDAGGHFIGPGFADDIIVAADGLRPTGPVVDRLDGSYTQDFVPAGDGIATVRVTALGVALPPVQVATGAPVPGVVTPPGGTNDVSTTVVIPGLGGNLRLVTGVSLLLRDTEVPLANVQIDEKNGTVTAYVPPGLTPGLYEVIFWTADGPSPLSGQGGFFRVVGHGRDFPETVQQLDYLVDRLLGGGAPIGEGPDLLGELLRALEDVPPGPNLTEGVRRRAVEEAVRLLLQGRSQVTEEDIPAIVRTLEAGEIDARFIPHGPADTPPGEDVLTDLGNNTRARFGEVTRAGQTGVALRPGPEEFAPEWRGDPHVTYVITTTAEFNANAGIEVEIQYEEQDFRDESSLRLFHKENGRWVDTTTQLDTTANVIRGQVSGFSEFVIATNAPACYVGLEQIQTVAGLWRQNSAEYDTDGNGTITVVDIMQWMGLWGKPCPGG